MRAFILPTGVLVMALMLGGCGQKGPLYREAPAAETASQAVSAADREDTGEAAGDGNE